MFHYHSVGSLILMVGVSDMNEEDEKVMFGLQEKILKEKGV